MLAIDTRPSEAEATRKANRILDLILERSNPLSPDRPLKSPEARDRLLERIRPVVLRQEPLRLVLPAFPAKSPNPEKTLSHLPDYGEVLALKDLDELCRRLGTLHGPGARLVICSDGRVFSDLVRVRDRDVNEYADGIRDILGRWRLEHLDTFSLDDVLGGFEFHEMRGRLVAAHGTPLEEIRRRTREEPAHRSLFNGIHRFVFEDRVVLESGKSRNRIREEAKQVAYEVIQRSNAWSALVEERFPDAVRLSIHPQDEHSLKIGVRLLRSRNIWRTPWHGVALGDGTEFRLTTRKSAQEAGARLVSDGRYPFYLVRNLDRMEGLA